MARRNQRPNAWLATDDTTGFTKYASELFLDYWGNRTAVPLERNLQEICVPLDDPYPVPFYRGSNYENAPTCVAEDAPIYVGLTTVRTNPNNAAFVALNLAPAIPNMAVGCNFIVY